MTPSRSMPGPLRSAPNRRSRVLQADGEGLTQSIGMPRKVDHSGRFDVA